MEAVRLGLGDHVPPRALLGGLLHDLLVVAFRHPDADSDRGEALRLDDPRGRRHSFDEREEADGRQVHRVDGEEHVRNRHPVLHQDSCLRLEGHRRHHRRLGPAVARHARSLLSCRLLFGLLFFRQVRQEVLAALLFFLGSQGAAPVVRSLQAVLPDGPESLGLVLQHLLSLFFQLLFFRGAKNLEVEQRFLPHGPAQLSA